MTTMQAPEPALPIRTAMQEPEPALPIRDAFSPSSASDRP
jgi:hypothetical protein